LLMSLASISNHLNRRFLVILILSLLMSEHALSRPQMGVFSNIESTTYSDVMSIDGFIDEFSGTLESGDHALTHDVAEVGFQVGDWRVSRIMRYDYEMQFSQDTANLNYRIENDLPIDEDAAYEIFIAAEHLRSTGFKVLRSFKFKENITFSVGLSWLESEQYYSGSVNITTNRGDLTDARIEALEAEGAAIEAQAELAETQEEYLALGDPLLALGDNLEAAIAGSNFSGGASYFYYEPALREDEQDDFQDVDFSAPNGKGYTLDVALDWRITDRWTVGFNIRDFYSQIRWDQTPATQASFDGTQAALDALEIYDQFVREDVINRLSGTFFTPLNPENPDDPAAVLPELEETIIADNSSAVVQNQSYTQRLPAQRFYHVHYDSLQWWSVKFQWETYRVADFYHFRGELWNFLAVEWHPSVSAYGLELYHRFAKIRFVTDDFDIDAAKYLSLNASLNLVF